MPVVKKILFTAISLFVIYFVGQAQKSPAARAMKVGDKVPTFIFNHVLNTNYKIASLDDFKGKLVILDFWNMGCLSCIKAMPDMEAIQNEFKDSIKILLVNAIDPLEKLNGYPANAKAPNVRNTKLPLILGEQKLMNVFPHDGEPFQVWIGSDRTIKAMTLGVSQVTSTRIRSVLAGRYARFSVDSSSFEDIFGKAYDHRFLRAGNERFLKNLKYYSIILPRLNVSPFAYEIIDSISQNPIGRRYVDYPISLIFQVAYNFGNPNRIVLELDNPARFIRPRDSDSLNKWLSDNVYCYEYIYPPDVYKKILMMPGEQFKIQQDDIERFFRITGKIEKRRMKCLALVRIDTIFKFHQSIESDLQPVNGIGYESYNCKLETLCDYLERVNYGIQPVPVINRTGITVGVDLEIKSSLKDISGVKKDLSKYGLDLIESEEDIDVLVLRDIR